MMQALQDLVETQIEVIKHILPPYSLDCRHDIVYLPAMEAGVPFIAVDTFEHAVMQHLVRRIQKVERCHDTHAFQSVRVALGNASQVLQLERG